MKQNNEEENDKKRSRRIKKEEEKDKEEEEEEEEEKDREVDRIYEFDDIIARSRTNTALPETASAKAAHPFSCTAASDRCMRKASNTARWPLSCKTVVC
jgi:hypothetical protein